MGGKASTLDVAKAIADCASWLRKPPTKHANWREFFTIAIQATNLAARST